MSGYTLEKHLNKRILSLYKDQIHDYNIHTKNEVNYLLRKEANKIEIRNHILSRAKEFWNKRDPPTGEVPLVGKRNYISELVDDLCTVLENKNISYTKKPIKPRKVAANRLIEDGEGLVKQELNKKKPDYFFVQDPLKCDRNMIRIFRYMEGDLNLPYGSDLDSFGFFDLWLSPSQILELRNIQEDPFSYAGIVLDEVATSDEIEKLVDMIKAIKYDCEDMHNLGASFLDMAGVPEFRYRCVMGGKEGGGGGHLTLFVLDDSLNKWRNMEFTPEYKNLRWYNTIRKLPKFGSGKTSMAGKDVWASYSKGTFYKSFNAIPTKNDMKSFVNGIEIEFPKEMFELAA